MHNLKRGIRSYVSLSAFTENQKNTGQLELWLNPGTPAQAAWKAVAWSRAPGAVTERNKSVWPPAASFCREEGSCYLSTTSTMPLGDLLAQQRAFEVFPRPVFS